VEKIVLLCFLMAVIGVLAEWSRAPQASRPAGHPSPSPRSPPKRHQHRMQRLAR
jgi:hypothetical protein